MTNIITINTLDDIISVPVRKTHTEGRHLKDIELSDNLNVEIRADYNTNQPFAVLYDLNWNPI